MNDARFVPRYLLQIASKGEWKTVAYLNDPDEVRRTIENVPDLRAFDTWKNAAARLYDRPEGRRKQDLVDRWVAHEH